MFPALEGIFSTPGGGGGSLSVTSDSATPWTAARRASLAFTISQRDCVPTGPHLAEVAQSCPVPTDPPPHPWTLSRLLCHLLLAFGWFFTHSHSYYLPGPGDTRFCSAGSDPLLSRVGSGCEAPAVHCSPSVLPSVFHELVTAKHPSRWSLSHEGREGEGRQGIKPSR